MHLMGGAPLESAKFGDSRNAQAGKFLSLAVSLLESDLSNGVEEF